MNGKIIHSFLWVPGEWGDLRQHRQPLWVRFHRREWAGLGLSVDALRLGWIGTDLYDFTNESDGGYPWGGLIFDPLGNLYGTTTTGGSGNGGTVFQLTPSNGNWMLTTRSTALPDRSDGRLVVGPLAASSWTTPAPLWYDLRGWRHRLRLGFQLTPSNGSWIYTSLHDFTGGSDGAYPYSNLVFDANGNLYGTASVGGTGTCTNGCGVIFEITP